MSSQEGHRLTCAPTGPSAGRHFADRAALDGRIWLVIGTESGGETYAVRVDLNGTSAQGSTTRSSDGEAPVLDKEYRDTSGGPVQVDCDTRQVGSIKPDVAFRFAATQSY